MTKFLIEGRIIPERVDFNSQPLQLVHQLGDERRLTTRIEIIKSKIFVYVEASENFDTATIRNIVFSTVGDLANYGGFNLVIGISYEIDSITNFDTKETTVFGAEGYVFDDVAEFGERLTAKSLAILTP